MHAAPSITHESIADSSGTGDRNDWPDLIIIVSLFFLWETANNPNDIMIFLFRKTLSLSDLGTGFVGQVVHLGYLILAIPASAVLRYYGYQFPKIFALAVEGLEPLRCLGSSLVIMAIIGGAGVTALTGWVSDRVGISTAILAPAVCFAVVFIVAIACTRSDAGSTKVMS
ncbi:hypothetical protein [Sphingomonas mollis]|uniref:MFS transporter n=1 Tax=Sphingomonas mollis TaxID=2795726 RepID=A0ABS0XM16_9SPHN|nr:hypothetical protein [Sphingomonas sp. BT553]MBJ6121076.1 hypothetical protein [Sphingomonas sp. BT553]